MKKKLGILVTVTAILLSGGIYFFVGRKKKCRLKEKKVIEDVEETPESLLKKIVEDLLEKDEWNTEKDFQDRLTKKFMANAKAISWLESLPYNLSGLLEKLNDMGLSEKFSKELEKKYRVGN